MKEETTFTRRNFIGTLAAAGAVTLACSKSIKDLDLPAMLQEAPDGPSLKAGVVGCDQCDRGNTAARLDDLHGTPADNEVHSLA